MVWAKYVSRGLTGSEGDEKLKLQPKLTALGHIRAGCVVSLTIGGACPTMSEPKD
jgi:hypothetical protein